MALNEGLRNLFHHTLIMTLYSTAMRRAELCQLATKGAFSSPIFGSLSPPVSPDRPLAHGYTF